MGEPPDKTRVVRLVKKPQSAPPESAKSPPPEAPPSTPPRPRPRFGPRMSPLGHRRGKKKPVQRRQGPRRPAVPPQPKPVPIVLSEEQKARILSLYRSMVAKGERPPEGRRKKIAALLNIPYANVAEVVRNYITHARYRWTNFDIEKAYWQAVRAGETNARTIAARIAEQLGQEEGRVWWWLEKLHEPRKSFAQDPEVEESKRSAVVALYEEYLQWPEPPEKGLHQFLAEQVGGLSPRQVHKILWQYRMNQWRLLEGTQRESAPETAPAPEHE